MTFRNKGCGVIFALIAKSTRIHSKCLPWWELVVAGVDLRLNVLCCRARRDVLRECGKGCKLLKRTKARMY